MRLRDLHPWDLIPTEAIALQRKLAPQIIRAGDPANVRLVAAADVAFPGSSRGWQGGLARAAIVLMRYNPGVSASTPNVEPQASDLAGQWEVLEHHVIETPVAFPYVPGLLSFREIPALALAFGRLSGPPDLILVDGQGVAHPRRFGLAAHLGLLAGIPTIGVAKSRLCGEATEPAPERGATSPLTHGGELVGLVLRTRAKVKPLYVSVGHKISLESAAQWVLRFAPTHRLPEPIRLADRLSKGHNLPS